MKPAEATSSNELFSDHFDGATLDTSKWVAEQNVNNGTGGSITIANSSVYLTSDGTSFPIVYTASSPFPTSGDFAVEFDIKYTRLVDWGTGLWISNGQFVPNSDALNSNILQVWGGHDGTGSRAFVLLFNKQVYNEIVQKNPFESKGSSLMIFRLQYSQGTYILYLNGTVLASETSSLRADTIGFGHPRSFYIPESYNGPWTSFRVGSIRLLPPTSLTIYNSPTLVSDGNCKVDINGTLNDSSNVPLPDRAVVLSYMVPNTSSWNLVTSTTTDSNGNYATTWFAPATGTFVMKAEWVGDARYGGTFICTNISITSEVDQSLFLAESNSTLSSLSFNSTAKEIAFTVSGPSGTTGYVRFLVSKTLFDSADFKVYLDGKNLECNVTSQGDFQSLYFQYNHSTHNVVIRLPTIVSTPTFPADTASPSIPEFPPWTILPALLLTLFIVGSLRKRKGKHKIA